MRFRPCFSCSIAALFALSLTPRAAGPGVQIEMKNVRLHAADGIVLDVANLRGTMVSRTAGAPPVFDDQRSFVLHLRHAELSLDVMSLQNLLNQFVFGYEGAPVKQLTVQTDHGQLALKGKLHKGIDVPFSVKASVSVTTDGRMRLHTESMKAVGVPAKGLLELFGLKLEDVMNVKARKGIEIQDNDIIIAAGQVLPPPEIAGRLARVTVSGNRIVQVFDDGGQARRAAHAAVAERQELRLFRRRGHPVRQADDARCRSAADRQRPEGRVRLLPGPLQRAARRRLFEEYARQGAQDLHAGLRRPQAGGEKSLIPNP